MADLEQIAETLSALEDIDADAMQKVGNDGVITVEENKGLETETEVVEGMQFDRGYLSPYFVTDPERMEVSLEDAHILIHEKKISSMKDLLPVLEKVMQAGKPLAIKGTLVTDNAIVIPPKVEEPPPPGTTPTCDTVGVLGSLITTIALLLSATPVSRLPNSTAMGTALIYIFVAGMGARADVAGLADAPAFVLGAFIWIFIHGAFCLAGAWLFRVDVHSVAIASAANIGAAASAPIVAAHHKPSLVPVSVLMALLGYAMGNYLAPLTGYLAKFSVGQYAACRVALSLLRCGPNSPFHDDARFRG